MKIEKRWCRFCETMSSTDPQYHTWSIWWRGCGDWWRKWRDLQLPLEPSRPWWEWRGMWTMRWWPDWPLLLARWLWHTNKHIITSLQPTDHWTNLVPKGPLWLLFSQFEYLNKWFTVLKCMYLNSFPHLLCYYRHNFQPKDLKGRLHILSCKLK